MQNPSGTFIVLEGADGSGKGTQFNLLRARLEAVGHDVEVFDFPRYDKESSYFVREYLNGRYGKAVNINPYTSSLFFAMDRYEAAFEIKKALAAGKIVMSNRYVGSNMAHQGSKFDNPAEQRGFFVWEDNLEFELLGIPRPTLNIFLRVPAEIAYELIAKKQAREYTTKKRDEHEGDINHLRRSVATYDTLCQLFPKDFTRIDCTAGGQLLSIPEINNKIWQIVQPLLPAKPAKQAKARTVTLNAPEEKVATEAAPQAQSKLEVLVPQLAISDGLEAGLNLRIASDWAKSGYGFYIPADLPKKTLAKYNELMSQIVELHKAMRTKAKRAKLSHDAILPATPLAAMVKVEVNAAPEELNAAIERLASTGTPSAVLLANELNQAAKKLWPNQFKKADVQAKNGEPEPLNKIIARLSADLPQGIESKTEAVELLEVSPKNEFRALIDALYPRSNLTRPELEAQIDTWNYQQKATALESALRSADHETLKNFTYLFDVIADRLTLNEILKSPLAGSLKIQAATPRYGYEVSKEIDEAVLTDDYLGCFDKSLEAFSTLQASGHNELAPFATLLGHKTRLEINASLFSLKEAGESKTTANLRSLLEQMKTKIAEHHPIASEALAEPKPVEQPKKAEKPAPAKPQATKKSRRGNRKPKK